MANAIKHISVQRGYDVTEYTLCCFGGAGGQHACLVADALGMTRVLIHPLAGVLSAYGMGLADMRDDAASRPSRQRLAAPALAELAHALRRAGRRRAHRRRAQGVRGRPRSTCVAALHLRYEGTDTRWSWRPVTMPRRCAATFEAAHRQRYGFVCRGKALVTRRSSVEAIGRTQSAGDGAAGFAAAAAGRAARRRDERACSPAARWHEAPRLRARATCGRATRSPAPPIVAERNATTVVEPGWQARR